MLSNLFHRDAENMIWEMYDHVFQGNKGYAKYRFGFISKVPDFKGQKVLISGFCFFKFQNKKIKEYSESVNGGLAMVQLGVNPLKIEKVFYKWLKRSLDSDVRLQKISNYLNTFNRS